jgi:hypothetical protein
MKGISALYPATKVMFMDGIFCCRLLDVPRDCPSLLVFRPGLPTGSWQASLQPRAITSLIIIRHWSDADGTSLRVAFGIINFSL